VFSGLSTALGIGSLVFAGAAVLAAGFFPLTALGLVAYSTYLGLGSTAFSTTAAVGYTTEGRYLEAGNELIATVIGLAGYGLTSGVPRLGIPRLTPATSALESVASHTVVPIFDEIFAPTLSLLSNNVDEVALVNFRATYGLNVLDEAARNASSGAIENLWSNLAPIVYSLLGDQMERSISN
jgi:hypothetical protein